MPQNEERRPEGRLSISRKERSHLCSGDVLSLPALGSLNNVKGNLLAFLKRTETVALDRGVVDENVFAVSAAQKSESLCIIEPLNCSLFHVVFLVLKLSLLYRRTQLVEFCEYKRTKQYEPDRILRSASTLRAFSGNCKIHSLRLWNASLLHRNGNILMFYVEPQAVVEAHVNICHKNQCKFRQHVTSPAIEQ
jgi:hypothetical protein